MRRCVSTWISHFSPTPTDHSIPKEFVPILTISRPAAFSGGVSRGRVEIRPRGSIGRQPTLCNSVDAIRQALPSPLMRRHQIPESMKLMVKTPLIPLPILLLGEQQIRFIRSPAIPDPELDRQRVAFLEKLRQLRLIKLPEKADRTDIPAERVELPVPVETAHRDAGIVLEHDPAALQEEIAHDRKIAGVQEIECALDKAVRGAQ